MKIFNKDLSEYEKPPAEMREDIEYIEIGDDGKEIINTNKLYRKILRDMYFSEGMIWANDLLDEIGPLFAQPMEDLIKYNIVSKDWRSDQEKTNMFYVIRKEVLDDLEDVIHSQKNFDKFVSEMKRKPRRKHLPQEEIDEFNKEYARLTI